VADSKPNGNVGNRGGGGVGGGGGAVLLPPAAFHGGAGFFTNPMNFSMLPAQGPLVFLSKPSTYVCDENGNKKVSKFFSSFKFSQAPCGAKTFHGGFTFSKPNIAFNLIESRHGGRSCSCPSFQSSELLTGYFHPELRRGLQKDGYFLQTDRGWKGGPPWEPRLLSPRVWSK